MGAPLYYPAIHELLSQVTTAANVLPTYLGGGSPPKQRQRPLLLLLDWQPSLNGFARSRRAFYLVCYIIPMWHSIFVACP